MREMKQEKKNPQNKFETTQSKSKKQIPKQVNEDFELKMEKIQKEITSLNLEIQYLLEEKKVKDNTQKTLQKERKKLESCFLFKKLQKQKQSDSQNEKQSTILQRKKIQNQFRDVNEKIVKFIEQLEEKKQNKNISLTHESNQDSEASTKVLDKKLECQSLHLKQIFNPEQRQNHEKKASKLRQKLFLLYEKIHLNLERQEPYLHEKIFERIKRQAQSQTRKKLSLQISRLIKENAVWMSQETNRVNNQLQEQKVEQICMSNLNLMKKIMAKKVANNDWIFENYGDSKFIQESNSAFPVQRILNDYQEVLKKFHENKVADQLRLVRKINVSEGQENSLKKSLKQLLSQKQIENFLLQSDNFQQEFKQTEQNLLLKVQELQTKIQKIQKR